MGKENEQAEARRCDANACLIPIQYDWQFKRFVCSKQAIESKIIYRLHFVQCNGTDCKTQTLPIEFYDAIGIEPQYVEFIWTYPKEDDPPIAWKFISDRKNKHCEDKNATFFFFFDLSFANGKSQLDGEGVGRFGLMCPCDSTN